MVSWANEITRKDMEEIYELTYKYQMLQQEARYGDQGLPQQLSDRAYIELARVSNELSNKLEDSYYRMLDVYERWVDYHVGLAETSVAEDLLSLVTTYEDLLGYVSQDTLRGIVAEEAAKAIETYRKNELIDSSYYDGLDLSNMSLADLLALPIVQNDTDLFMNVRKAVMNASESLTEEREQKLSEYSEDTALGGAVSMLDRLRTEWQPLPEGLDQDIILIQEALTTAHNNGSMAQYLITQQGQIDPGAVEFLNGLSAGPQVGKWNQELSQLLGYPLGSRSAPTQEWYLAHLKRAMQRIAELLERI